MAGAGFDAISRKDPYSHRSTNRRDTLIWNDIEIRKSRLGIGARRARENPDVTNELLGVITEENLGYSPPRFPSS